MKVTGLVYLHSISHTRMAGSGVLSHQLFRRICGPHALGAVVMASTQWDAVSKARIIRENDLLEVFWKDTLDQGAIYRRIGATERERKHDTSNIIDYILRKRAVATQTQEELVEGGKRVPETEAVQHLREMLHKRLGDPARQDLSRKRKSV